MMMGLRSQYPQLMMKKALLYLYQKYYPLIAEEIASREKNTITTEKDEVST